MPRFIKVISIMIRYYTLFLLKRSFLRCITCERLSWTIICQICQRQFLKPQIKARTLACGIQVFSFYDYEELKFLLKTKYQFIGNKIFKILAANAFKSFAKNFNLKQRVFAIPLDDCVKKGYAHSAILAHALKSKFIKPLYHQLISSNQVKYAGKSLEYRLRQPRQYNYLGVNNIQVILCDDLVTSGLSLSEAKTILLAHKVQVLFALCLCDAKVNEQ